MISKSKKVLIVGPARSGTSAYVGYYSQFIKIYAGEISKHKYDDIIKMINVLDDTKQFIVKFLITDECCNFDNKIYLIKKIVDLVDEVIFTKRKTVDIILSYNDAKATDIWSSWKKRSKCEINWVLTDNEINYFIKTINEWNIFIDNFAMYNKKIKIKNYHNNIETGNNQRKISNVGAKYLYDRVEMKNVLSLRTSD